MTVVRGRDEVSDDGGRDKRQLWPAAVKLDRAKDSENDTPYR